MKLLSWNVRGLGDPRTVREVGKIAHTFSPKVLLLIETRRSAVEMDRLRVKWGFDNCFAVDSIGRGGGLAVLWNNDFHSEVRSYSKNYIDMMVEDDSGNWRITLFYGHPETSKRNETWSLLKGLNKQVDLPWICMGDFNEILSDEDKRGGAMRPERQLTAFRETVVECDFHELQVMGPIFTWSRSKGDDLTEIRLDRAMANSSWCERFNRALEEHVVNGRSDHLPIVVHVKGCKSKREKKRKRQFRFENMWCSVEGCKITIDSVWNSDTSEDASKVTEKIKRCGEALSAWNRNNFGNVNTKIIEKTNELSKLLNGVRSAENIAAIANCRRELNGWYLKEEIMWKQRAKDFWIKEGDRNSRYFHKSASGRKRNNRINAVKDDSGTMVSDEDLIENCFVDYFNNLFCSGGVQDMGAIFETITKKLSHEAVLELEKPFQPEEIEKAMKQMHPYKTAGPDGGEFPDCNQTNIVLIPKKKSPLSPADYRPISLCNVYYKIISKTLANRMKGALAEIISPNQSAFVPGRLIFDNTMVAYETVHTMRKKSQRRKGYMAIKLDMSKAYDRVEWLYLEGMMRTQGFPERWIHLVMRCVSTVSYSILINGRRSGTIKPTRGIRQGCPLSPYLFLICGEGLSSLLNEAEDKGRLRGIKAARYSPSVNHLLFADDSLVFCEANSDDARTVSNILKQYEAASGQKVNTEKSGTLFSPNMDEQVRNSISNILGIVQVFSCEKYLGLPLYVGKEKKKEFRVLKERIRGKLNAWNTKQLSQAGKAVLLQSVAQAAPIFAMSCFKLPSTLLDELNNMMARFWWGNMGQKRKIHWKSWEALCISKGDGGLGFRDFHAFNLAMLGKQWWRLMQNVNSLSFQVFQGKYLNGKDHWKVTVNCNASFLWKSLHEGRKVASTGGIWRVGDGSIIDAWNDIWIPELQGKTATDVLNVNHEPKSVYDLIDHNTRSWKTGEACHFFGDEIGQMISHIPLHYQVIEDQHIWRDNNSGSYTVKRAYYTARSILGRPEHLITQRNGIWKMIWSSNIMPKVKYFLWKWLHGLLPIADIMARRGMSLNSTCCICMEDNETFVHVFGSCSYITKVWNLFNPNFRVGNLSSLDRVDFCDKIITKATDFDQLEEVCYLLWWLWSNRNTTFHEHKCLKPETLVSHAKRYASDFVQTFNKPIILDCQKETQWTKPPAGAMKVNVDASFVYNSCNSKSGIVIRDSKGEVKCCGVSKFDAALSPLHAELNAILDGLILAESQAFEIIVVESDSQVGINEILNVNSDCYWKPLIAEIREMASSFISCKFNFVKREYNRLAHELAHYDIGGAFFRAWINKLPMEIRNMDV